MRRFLPVPLTLGLLAALTAAGPTGAVENKRSRESNVIPGHYIVVYKASVRDARTETEARERQLGFKSRFKYDRAVKGFAAKLNPGQVRKLRADADVDFVSHDRKVKATANVPLVSGEPVPPTGVRRILAGTTTTVRQASGVNVAVLDTGIQVSHTDLNAVDGKDCIDGSLPATDGNGHGTHVAGSIAAKNNGSGVTGVAPGTKTYAVRVLDNAGSGSFAGIVCGIDWVTANRTALNIKVANMSLGGLGDPVASCSTTTDAMHKAICNSTAGGVNYVVAAGNDGWDFDFPSEPNVPAAYPQVLTVSALSDSDGKSGATGGAPACRTGEFDDREASFSNFAATAAGQAHTIAAPGVCIKSTWPTTLAPSGGYNTISGTSMASPHMAGVVALCLNEAAINGPCAGKTTAQVITQMRSDAQSYNTANPSYGFLHDPLHSPISGEYYGFLTRTAPQAAAANVYTSGSTLVFNASAGKADTVAISLITGPKYRVTNTTATITPGPGCTAVNANTVDCSTSGVASISANAGDGNDSVNVSTAGLPAVLLGGTGTDTLTGGSRNDTLDGGGNNDAMGGGGGHDTATYAVRTSTQPVNASIDGVANDGQSGEGDNVKTDVENLIGGAGNDVLTGSSAANRFDGRGGADVFNGLGGADTVSYAIRTLLQPVNASIDGVANDGQSGEGDNVKTDVEDLVGGAGNDTLTAIVANTVVNVLSGGAGNDRIKTREGTTTHDRIVCGGGTDSYDRDAADADADDCETPATL